MTKVDVLSNEPNQTMTLVLDNGEQVRLSVSYVENQQGWFYSISYGQNFLIYNRRLVVSVNLLRAFRNNIPFGIACLSSDGYEPVFIDDFSSGRVSVFVLNPDDVLEAERVISQYA